MTVFNRCRANGCYAFASDSGWCSSHDEAQGRTMIDPIVEGLCSALLAKGSARRGARCKQRLRGGNTRCVYHKGYIEPELL